MVEKRTFGRFNKAYPATLKIKGSSSSLPCQTINISRTGVAIKVKKCLPKSVIASLHINSTEKNSSSTITAEAQEIWNKPLSNDGTSCYGLRFTEMEEDSSLALRRLLGYEVDHIVTASYLPEKIITNEDIIKMGFKGSAASLERGLGAKERRAAAKDETHADMLAKVGREILQKAGVLPEELDRIVCCADPGDAIAPATATAVQAKVGATCPAFGVSMSCAGWVAGVEIALKYLDAGEKCILVLASVMASSVFFRNPMHRAIFGDGTGGILLESHHREHFLTIGLWTNGQHYSKIFSPYPWSKTPKDIPAEYKGSFYMDPDQKMFFEPMNMYLIPFAQRLLNEAKVNLEDIDLFLLHYPSRPLFEHSLKLLHIPRKKTFHNFTHYGNLVAAEMPIFLDEAITSGRIKSGDLLFILTYGAGFTMGGLILYY